MEKLQTTLTRRYVGRLYTHHKNPHKQYRVAMVAFREADLKPLIIYGDTLTGVLFGRTLEEFEGRVDGQPRFRAVSE